NVIVISGSGTNRELSIFPPPNVSGTGVAFITVRDSGIVTSGVKFNVEIRPVNDPPRISSIDQQFALKGQGLLTVPFSVVDPDPVAQRLNLQAWSSRQSVVSNAALRIVQVNPGTNRLLQITLSPQSAAGSTAITLQADDAQETNRVSFVLNVVEPEFA